MICLRSDKPRVKSASRDQLQTLWQGREFDIPSTLFNHNLLAEWCALEGVGIERSLPDRVAMHSRAAHELRRDDTREPNPQRNFEIGPHSGEGIACDAAGSSCGTSQSTRTPGGTWHLKCNPWYDFYPTLSWEPWLRCSSSCSPSVPQKLIVLLVARIEPG